MGTSIDITGKEKEGKKECKYGTAEYRLTSDPKVLRPSQTCVIDIKSFRYLKKKKVVLKYRSPG